MNVPYNKSPNSSHITAQWYDWYFGHRPPIANQSSHSGVTEIYLISFNNPMLVAYQIEMLKMFFNAPYKLIVVDNNCGFHTEASERVRQFCLDANVDLVIAPHNHYQEEQFFDPTMKLGTTMNWLFHNIIKNRKPEFFGFLDHDCFLFKRWECRPTLMTKGAYGTISQHNDKWNIHVINNFFRFSFVQDLPLDFRASYKHQLDTGGANYDILYSRLDKEEYRLKHIGVRYMAADIARKDAVQHYEIIDDRWFHMCATSHDQLVGDGEKKMLYAKGFLDAIIRTNK